jgi:hypothetical protein
LVLIELSGKVKDGSRLGQARAHPDQDDPGGDRDRARSDQARAGCLVAVACVCDAETDRELSALDQRPDERAEAAGAELQNDSSAIVRQVSSRAATTASQAAIFGSS